MKINLKILAFFAFSAFVFTQASERIQNIISYCKDKGSSALEFAKNNKKKAALRTATVVYAVHLLKPKNPTETIKKATCLSGKKEFINAWFPEDKQSIFTTGEHGFGGTMLKEKLPEWAQEKGFGPLSHMIASTRGGRWLLFVLAFLIDKKIATK